MNMQPPPQALQANVRQPQKGAVLILIAFILGLGAAAYLLKALNTSNLQAKQDAKTYQTLAEAKRALIAWAVSHPNTPGLMPYPDRNNDGNYDDTSDCYASNINFSPDFTLGRLPLFKNDPNCVNADNPVNNGLSVDFRDGTGERLWYEVSRNLLHDYKNNGDPDGTSPIINPSIINAPINPWFVVLDRNGKVVSDRVAAVIIAPNQPIGTQVRSGGIANADQYLDKVVMANGTPYRNYGYQVAATTPIQRFIIGDDFKSVAKNDATYKNQTTEPYYFNDKLVYITIDELMYALEKRVGQELTAQLRNHKLSNGSYPYAAALGDANNTCSEVNLQGFLPVNPASANCASALDCTVNLAMTQVKFTLVATEIYGSKSGACTRSANTCTCTGAGSCNRAAAPSRAFTCTTNGSCTSSGTNASGSFTFTYQPKAPDKTFVSGGCVGSAGTVTCNGLGDFVSHTNNCSQTHPELTTLPKWFTDNQWQDYFYYELSPTSILTAGGKVGVSALLIATGEAITNPPFASKGSAQTRPSSLIDDYLDSDENTDGNLFFEATNKQRTRNYNDQIFIVSP